MNHLIKHIVKMLVLLQDVDSGPLDETEAQDEVMMHSSSPGCSISDRIVLGNVDYQLQ